VLRRWFKLVGWGLLMGVAIAPLSPVLAESLSLDDPPTGEQPMSPATPGTEIVSLTLPDLLTRTLAGNRSLQNQALGRIVQQQQLVAAEQAFNPRFIPILRVDATRRDLGTSGTTPGSILLGRDTINLDQDLRLTTALTTRLGTEFEIGLTPFENGQTLQFGVSQPLLRGFGTAVNEAPLNQTRLDEDISQLALRSTIIDTLTTAILGYNTLINAQAQVQIQTEALARRQRQLEISQALVQAGRRAPISLFDPERSVADAQRNLVDAQNQLDQANSALLNLIGTDQDLRFVATVETIIQLFEAATAQLATYQPETLVALALDQRTDYRQAQLQRQQQVLDLLLAEDNLRWQLNAVANGLLGDSSSSVVGLVATRTFGDPQPETTRVASDIALQQQDNTLAQLQEQIRNDVVAGLATARSSLLQVEAAERATFNAGRQLEADQARGDVDQFQLITQEEVLVNAQTSELAARIAFLNSMASLDQTVGITIERWIDEIDIGLELLLLPDSDSQ
jgi:outer membrane protein